jgi:hypothetical protein
MSTVKKSAIISYSLLAILFLAGFIGCAAPNSTTSILQSTSESASDGFSFTVNVSDTHPSVGERVVITDEIQTPPQFSGRVIDQIINAAGKEMVETNGANILGGFQTSSSGFTFTPQNLGTYTLTASDSATSLSITLSITPIQIVVTG